MTNLYSKEVLPFYKEKGADEMEKVRHNSYEELRLLSVNDVCELLQVKRTKLYNLINQGTLRAVKQGKRTVFRYADVYLYINQLKEYGG